MGTGEAGEATLGGGARAQEARKRAKTRDRAHSRDRARSQDRAALSPLGAGPSGSLGTHNLGLHSVQHLPPTLRGAFMGSPGQSGRRGSSQVQGTPQSSCGPWLPIRKFLGECGGAPHSLTSYAPQLSSLPVMSKAEAAGPLPQGGGGSLWGVGLPGPLTHPHPPAPRLEGDGTGQAHMGLKWPAVSLVGSVHSLAEPTCVHPVLGPGSWPSPRSGPQRAGGGNVHTPSSPT